MKRLLAVFLVASAIMLMCPGCTDEEPEEYTDAVTVLKIIKPSYISDFSQNIAEFNEANPNIQVKFIDAPAPTEKRHQLYVSALSGSDSSIDIYWINDEWIKEFAEKKYIIPIEQDIVIDNSRYIVDARKRFSEGENLYALPVGMDMGVIFYRRDKISNFPKTWDEIISVYRNSDFGLTINFGVENSDAQDIIYNIEELKSSMNVSCAEVLSLYKEFTDDLAGNEKSGNVISGFKIGSAAMLMCNSTLWQSFNGDTSAVKGSVGVATLPNGNKYARSYGLAINANSDNRQAAIKFLDFMNGKEQQRRLSRDTSVIPIIEELYNDDMILDENPYIKSVKENIRRSSSFAEANACGENLKKTEELLTGFFNNEETSVAAGRALDELIN